MADTVEWFKLEEGLRLSDGDVIKLVSVEPGDPNVIEFALQSTLNVTWRKAIRLVNTGGMQFGEAYTRDSDHGPNAFRASFFPQVMANAKLEFTKAKTLGVQTGMYQVGDLAQFKGKRLLFEWRRDFPGNADPFSLGGAWQQLPGAAKDVGVGADGSLWVIGTNPVPGGFGIFRWTGQAWTAVSGGAVRIAVAPDGQPWVVNDAQQIFRRTSNGWDLQPGEANDIGVGANGTVWVVGTDSQSGGFGLWKRDAQGWSNIDGGATQVSVGPGGKPWVVNDVDEIYWRVGNGWQRLPDGAAVDIAVGSDAPGDRSSVWVIGTNATPGGYGIFRWNFNAWNWKRIDGGAVRIAVDPQGLPVVVNDSGAIFRRSPGGSVGFD
jgi:Tectonin domain